MESTSTAPHAVPLHQESRHDQLKRELRSIVMAWVFGAIWMWTINGAAMTRFAKQLHTPEWAFGILAALPYVGALFQLPASLILERYGHRKVLFLVLATFSRTMWTAIALIPWIFPNLDGYWWMMMVGLLLLGWATFSASVPPWMSWMADVIPRRIRGRYFGFRSRVGQLIGLVATMTIGYLLDMAEQVNAVEPGTMLKVTSLILALAGLFGVLDVQTFTRIRDLHKVHTNQNTDLDDLVRKPLRDPNFRWYLAYNFTLNLGIGFVGQYVWLYCFDILKMGNQQTNLLLTAIPLLVLMLAYPFWGRLLDKLGKKPVLIIGSFCIIWGSLGWMMLLPQIAQPEPWGQHGKALLAGDVWPMLKAITGWHWPWISWIGYMSVLWTTFCWPGVELANFNMILEKTGSQTSGRGGTAFVAVNSLAVALGGILSGLLGALIAGIFKPLHLAIPILGIVLTYHGVLFLLSTIIRVITVLFALKLREPTSVGTREAIQYVGEDIYSNVRQAVQLPTRLVGQAFRWTYQLNQPIRKHLRFGNDPNPRE